MSKILFLNCSDAGSTGHIIIDTVSYIKQLGWQSILCVPRITEKNDLFDKVYQTSLKYEQGLYCRLSKITGNPLGGIRLSTIRIINIIKREKPDVVHVHCINSYMCNVYEILAFLKKNNIPTVITNHAEFFYTGTCDHAFDCNQWLRGCNRCPLLDNCAQVSNNWKRMKETFYGFKSCVMTSVSPWVNSRSCISGITNGIPNTVVENGIDVEIYKPRDTFGLRDKLGISKSSKIIIHVTPNFSIDKTHPKGGWYVNELAKRLIAYDIVFLVVGPHHNPLVSENIVLCGKITEREIMAKYYSLADLCLITGERETFSMPVAESMCCGTPIIGFRSGGPESIAIGEYAYFCDYGDIDSLESSLMNEWLIKKQLIGSSTISNLAKRRYSNIRMAVEYSNIYLQLINN